MACWIKICFSVFPSGRYVLNKDSRHSHSRSSCCDITAKKGRKKKSISDGLTTKPLPLLFLRDSMLFPIHSLPEQNQQAVLSLYNNLSKATGIQSAMTESGVALVYIKVWLSRRAVSMEIEE